MYCGVALVNNVELTATGGEDQNGASCIFVATISHTLGLG